MVNAEIVGYFAGDIAVFNKVEKIERYFAGNFIPVHFKSSFRHHADGTAGAVFKNKTVAGLMFNPIQLLCRVQ